MLTSLQSVSLKRGIWLLLIAGIIWCLFFSPDLLFCWFSNRTADAVLLRSVAYSKS